jgi:hypothetical protein
MTTNRTAAAGTIRITGSVLLMCGLSACATIPVGVIEPHPTIQLPATQQRLALVLSSAVAADAFDLSCGGGCTVRFSGFRASLMNGFMAGFAASHTLVVDNADLTLRFTTLTIEVDTLQRLIVHYAAQLDDLTGKTLGRSFGTLPIASRSIAFADTSLADALTRMFEQIARDWFVPLTGAPQPPPLLN